MHARLFQWRKDREIKQLGLRNKTGQMSRPRHPSQGFTERDLQPHVQADSEPGTPAQSSSFPRVTLALCLGLLTQTMGWQLLPLSAFERSVFQKQRSKHTKEARGQGIHPTAFVFETGTSSMWRQARGTGLPEPGKGQRALPCGMRSGLLCVLSGAFGAAWPTAPPPPSLAPDFPSLLPFSPSLLSPACAPGMCMEGVQGTCSVCLRPVPVLWNRVKCFLPQGPSGTLHFVPLQTT